jgi:hypothetical protein
MSAAFFSVVRGEGAQTGMDVVDFRFAILDSRFQDTS